MSKCPEVYGLKEYKSVLEHQLKMLRDPNCTPFGSDPSSQMSIAVRQSKIETLTMHWK